MLIRFNINNILSFKEAAKLSMIASPHLKKQYESQLITTTKHLKLVKTAVISGENASGKSNLLKAMGFMKQTVLNSLRDALLDESDKPFSLEKFALHSSTKHKPSEFEIQFLQNTIEYRYGFEIDNGKIVAEWLFHIINSKEEELFSRRYQQIKVNPLTFKEGLGKEEDVKDNVLFLSLLATLGKKAAMDIVEWFKKLNLITGIHDRQHKKLTIDQFKSDPQFYHWALNFIKYLGIANLSVLRKELGDIDLETFLENGHDEQNIEILASIHKDQSCPPILNQLLTFHRKYDENNVLIDTVAFKFENQESDGTKRLLYLLGPWYDALQNGKVLFVDEFDARLHSSLILRLIDYFHKYNRSGAQLICTVSNIDLLKPLHLRKDQIWIMEKKSIRGF